MNSYWKKFFLKRGQQLSIEDTICHLRTTFQDLEKNISDEIHHRHIERIREEPQVALDHFVKEFTAAAFELDKEDEGSDQSDGIVQWFRHMIEGYKPDHQPPQKFNNVTLFQRMPQGYQIKQPKDLEDLVNIVQEAADKHETVKAVGTCYAFSDVSFTTGTVLEINRYLHNVLEIDKSVLKDDSNEHLQTLLKVEGGTMMESISEALWPSARRDNPAGYRTLLNQTGYQGLSIAGTTGTGAHGSGLNKPPLTDMVASMHLVTVDGDSKVKQYWIEPTDGITDDDKFEAEYGQRGWELIQDDDTFYSSVCHIGCIGIVYSYIIRVEPAYYLEEHRCVQTWEDTKKQLPALFAANLKPRKEEDSLHSFEIWINPYPVPDCKTGSFEVKSVVITRKSAQPPRKNKRPFAFHADPWENELLRQAAVLVTRYTPELMPEFMNIALLATREKHPVTMPCTEALDLGSPNTTKAIVSELGIDASSVDNVIEATDALITQFQKILKDNRHHYASSPFSLRFTAPSTAYNAPQYGRTSCMIEAPILVGTPGAAETLTKFRTLLRDRFNGRPHWGQLNDMNFAKLQALYPDTYEKFVHNCQRFNKTGTFSNQFTAKIMT